jgi:hypothetical protein
MCKSLGAAETFVAESNAQANRVSFDLPFEGATGLLYLPKL